MAVNVNSLGSFYFRNWIGPPPQRLGRQLEVLEYPGVNYQAVRALGLRSELYHVESIVDLASFTVARNTFAAYKNLIGSGAQQMIWNNWNLDAENQRVLVMNVVCTETRLRSLICGGLNPPSLVDLSVRWTLLHVPYFSGN